MDSSPLISVIIVNWNGSNTIGECLLSVLNSSYDLLEIIVVDNGSTDDSVRIITRVAKERALILRQSANTGYARAANEGIKHARGRYCAILNNDCSVDPAWLNEAVQFFESDPDVGIVGCRQMRHREPDRIDSLFQIVNREFGVQDFGSGHGYRSFPPCRVFAPAGASAIYRAAMLKTVGAFNETYYAYYEESDLALRALLAGWKCVFSPDSIVYHRGSYSYSRKPAEKQYLLERNRLLFIFRNLPASYLRSHIPLLAGHECRAFLCALLRRGRMVPYMESRIAAFWHLLRFNFASGKKTAVPADRLDLLSSLKQHRYLPLDGIAPGRVGTRNHLTR